MLSSDKAGDSFLVWGQTTITLAFARRGLELDVLVGASLIVWLGASTDVCGLLGSFHVVDDAVFLLHESL